MGRQYKILIVDDDPWFRQFVNQTLSAQGLECLEARTAQEAERLLLQSPDLLFVDYRLPQIDGADWIRQLKDRGLTIPVIFCSGSSYDARVFTVVRNILSVDLILKKPLAAEVLAREVMALLKRYNCGNELEELPPAAEPSLHNYMDNPSFENLSPPLTEESHLGSSSGFAQFECDLQQEDEETKLLLAQLADEYIHEVPGFLSKLASEITGFGGDDSYDLLMDATNIAHQIRGTGSSMGFTELGALAAELEDRLKSLTPDEPQERLDREWLSGWREELLFYVELMNNMASCHIGAVQNESKPNAPLSMKIIREVPSPSQDSQEVKCEDEPAAPALRVLPVRVLCVLSQHDAGTVGPFLDVINENHFLCQYEVFATALDLLSQLDQKVSDLIILSTGLPGIDGFEACRMIQSHPRWQQVPVLQILPIEDIGLREQVFECGASDFALSPINHEELRVRVSGLLLRGMGNLPVVVKRTGVYHTNVVY